MDNLQIRAKFATYTGALTNVYALYNPTNEKLIIGRVDTDDKPLQEGYILVSDMDKDCDFYFEESGISQAITEYYQTKRSGKVQITADANAANPENAIENDGIKGDKWEYRILASISNAQVATLAIVRYINRNKDIEGVLDLFDDLNTHKYDYGFITV